MLEHFSPNEKAILSILGSRRRMTIAEITEQMYNRPPLHAKTTVANAIRRINAKCKELGLKWRLEGEGLGRGGRTIWKETK